LRLWHARIGHATVEVARLDTFIARRHTQRRQSEGERAAEEAWKVSVARFHERAREEKRQAWIEYHEALCRLHTQLADEHEEKAQRLVEGAA
jgi:hypothetical protein